MSGRGNFFSNYEPLTRDQAWELIKDTIGFEQFTPPLQQLIREVAEQGKATAFVSVVGMPELLKRAMEIVEWKANPTPLVTITIMYLILLLPLMYGSTLLERRLARWTTPHRA